MQQAVIVILKSGTLSELISHTRPHQLGAIFIVLCLQKGPGQLCGCVEGILNLISTDIASAMLSLCAMWVRHKAEMLGGA